MNNKMKYCIFSTFALMFFSFAGFGQTEGTTSKPTESPARACALTLKDAPVLHNVRLGMSRKDFEALFKPTVKVNGAPVNESIYQAQLYSADLRAMKDYEQIELLRALFYEDKIFRLTVSYDKSIVKWNSTAEFAENLSGKYNLPNNFWNFKPIETEGNLRCQDFNIFINNGSIILTDVAANQKMRNAASQKPDEKKKPSKP